MPRARRPLPVVLSLALAALTLWVSAPGAAAAGPTDIVINEVSSDNNNNGFTPLPGGRDLVELHNTGSAAIDLAGWKQIDSGAATAATVFSDRLYVNGVQATTIPAGGYGVFQSGAGLGSGGDGVKVYTPDGTLIDSVTYGAGQAGVDENVNVDGTYKALASCPNGGNAVLEVSTPSFGADNSTACLSGVTPLTGPAAEAPCQTESAGAAPGTVPAGGLAWPGSATPVTIDPQCYWTTTISGQDVSGLAFDPSNADVLYAVKNKSYVFRLVRSGADWVKDTTHGWSNGKELRFPGGSGQPDSEGLTVGPDGQLYLTTERDNTASGVPLDSILRFDPTSSATTLSASDQWVLTPDLGFTNADANLGFEGVTYVPDGFLTAAGFKKDDGTTYDPAAYPTKILPGLFFGAVEKTGHLRAYVLKTDHTYERVADVDTGLVGVMEAQYDADLGRIWAHCDNTCGNATTLLKVGGDGYVAVDRTYLTPTGLPNHNLEGFAVAPVSSGSNGTREVLWADDGNRLGHSLWRGTLDLALGLTQQKVPTPTIGGAAVFGRTLTAGVGSWDQGVTTHYVWKDGATVLATDAPLALTDSTLVGRTITLAVTGTKVGFATATNATTTVVAPATLTSPTPTVSGRTEVGQTLTAHAAWGPGPVALSYTWFADGRPIAGVTGSTLLLRPAQLGSTITVAVTGREPGYTDATGSSAPTAVVDVGLIETSTPTLLGKAKVGARLTLAPLPWTADGGPVTFEYRWYADGQLIKGATSATWRLKKAQVGTVISVHVFASAPGFATSDAWSHDTRKVKAKKR